MPRLLILSLVFTPDGVSTAQLMAELATDLHRRGIDVFVVTTRPHYNRDVVAEEGQPLKVLWPGLLWRSETAGVTVYHSRASAKSGGLLRRAAGWAVFHLIALLATLVFVRRADVIFVPSPLLTLGALGRALCIPLRAKLVYNVQELYPDLAVELGLLRNGAVIRALHWLEQYVYRKSAVVTTITDGIRRAVIRKGIDECRVVTIPNFVDVGELRPGPKANTFAAEHGWINRFVVLYAGNIGHAQGLEALLAAAASATDARVLFAFVGDGVAKTELQAVAHRVGLKNVQFVAHQPYARVPEIYAAADLCIVPLLSEIKVGALPSKVFRIMACSRPILALCDPHSDLAQVIQDAEAGVVCAPSNTDAIVQTIAMILQQPQRAIRMGERGREYVVSRLSRPIVTKRYAELFTRISADPT